MVNIAVLISGSGTNLQSLIDACNSKEISGEIKVVISNKESAYGLTRAKNANIKAIFEKDETKVLQILKDENIDLVVLAGYLAIISDEFINQYKNKIINIHPSLIPAFCGSGYYGLRVHKKAFERGVKVAGATVHFVSNVVDGGPIILQKAIDVSDCKSPEAMQEKILLNVEHKLLPEAVRLYCLGKVKVNDERVEII